MILASRLALLALVASGCGGVSSNGVDSAAPPMDAATAPIDARAAVDATAPGDAIVDALAHPPDLAPPPDSTACVTPSKLCQGVCTDVTSDAQNCGSCGFTCNALNGTNPCVDSVCTPQCDSKHLACGAPAVGCDTDKTTNTDCGACNNACTGPTTCGLLNGAYQCLTCEQRGLVTCGSQCLDVSADAKNCGGCNVVCPGGTCAGGHCTSCVVQGPTTIPANGTSHGFLLTCPNMAPGAHYTLSSSGNISSTPTICSQCGTLQYFVYLCDGSNGCPNWYSGSSAINYGYSVSSTGTVGSSGSVDAYVECDMVNHTDWTCDFDSASSVKIQAQ